MNNKEIDWKKIHELAGKLFDLTIDFSDENQWSGTDLEKKELILFVIL